jgi:AAA family ATP:ADP antiporter
MPRPEAAPDARATRLDRALRLFTDVQAGEGRTAVLLFLNVFLILCAYYFLKPMREGWLAVSHVEGLSKMEIKAYSSFGQSLLLLGAIGVYARFVGHWPRRVLIHRTTVFLMSNMVVFWLLQPNFFVAHLPGTGIAFYLWVGMFGVFVVAQFWAFTADFYAEERGTRLLPFIAIGATSGAAVGSLLAEKLVAWDVVGAENLLLAALVPLGVALWLTHRVDPASDAAAAAPAFPKGRPRGAVQLVVSTPFLLAVAAVTLILNWVNTNGENLLFRVVQEVLGSDLAARGLTDPREALERIREGTTLFYSDFFFWVNLVALVLQALVASRLLKYGGFGAIFLLLPAIALTSYTAMALVPVLAVIKVMKIAENATDYSISNTARHVLWLPMEPDVTYKAKPTIDSLFVRMGDGLAALTVVLGVHVFSLSLEGFFAVNVSLVCLWLGLAFWVVRAHRRLGGQSGSGGLDGAR